MGSCHTNDYLTTQIKTSARDTFDNDRSYLLHFDMLLRYLYLLFHIPLPSTRYKRHKTAENVERANVDEAQTPEIHVQRSSRAADVLSLTRPLLSGERASPCCNGAQYRASR